MNFLRKLFRSVLSRPANNFPTGVIPSYCKMCGKKNVRKFRFPGPDIKYLCSQNCADLLHNSVVASALAGYKSVAVIGNSQHFHGMTSAYSSLPYFCYWCGQNMGGKMYGICKKCGFQQEPHTNVHVHDIYVEDKYGSTELILALQDSLTEEIDGVVQSLITKGVDLNAKDKNGYTALIMASFNGHKNVVMALIAAGVDVNVHDKKGCTALMAASQEGHTLIVDALIINNVNVNVKCFENWTALALASLNGHTEIVIALIAAGANLNAQGGDALMRASAKGHIEVVNVLIAAGADVHAKDCNGSTVLDFAGNDKKIVSLLKRAGATR